MPPENVYDFTVRNARGEEVSLRKFKGKVLVVVNVASQCGFTPQYKGLEALYRKFHSRGLEVLAFPCNQFGFQEPGTDEEIQTFCHSNYGVTFPVFSKIDVNGAGRHPLYAYLKARAPGVLGTKAIKWNFTKFLVSPSGEVLKRYAPRAEPESLEEDILNAFAAKSPP